jgi:hypothetical protein
MVMSQTSCRRQSVSGYTLLSCLLAACIEALQAPQNLHGFGFFSTHPFCAAAQAQGRHVKGENMNIYRSG